MAKFGPKLIGPFKMLEIVNNNLIIDTEGERTALNLHRVRNLGIVMSPLECPMVNLNFPDHARRL